MNDVGATLDLSPQEERLRRLVSGQREAVRRWLSELEANNQVPPASAETGEHQRLQTRVPTAGQPAGTVVSMGRRAPGHNFDGYGLTTVGHVALSAEGGKTESTMTVQANGQLLVQSDQDSLFLLSTAPATLASSSVTNVAGAGVTIAAGGGAPVVMIPIAGAAPSAPDSTSGTKDAMQGIADAWQAIDEGLAKGAEARNARRDATVPQRGGALEPAAQGEAATSAHVSGNAPGEPSEAGAGILSLFADKQLLAGAREAASVSAGEALTLSGKAVTVMAEAALEGVAGADLLLTVGADLSAVAAGQLELVGHEGPGRVAVRTGAPLTLEAGALELGAITPEDPQAPTRAVLVRSTEHVSIGTDRDPEREARPAGIHLDSHAEIVARSAKTVTLEATDALILRVGGQDVRLEMSKDKRLQLVIGATTIDLAHDAGIKMGHHGDLIEARSDKVTAGTSASDRLEVAPGKLTLKGGKINIG